VNRADFVVALAASATARPRTRITAEIAITPTAPDLLVPFTVSIALRNPTHAVQPVDFPSATELYRIDVLRGGTTVWTSAHPASLHTPRRIELSPGTQQLVFYDVDCVTGDRHAFAAGAYVVRVTILGSVLTSVYERTITYAEPLTIAQALKSSGEVTTAGAPGAAAGGPSLTDATGTLRVSTALGLHPSGRYIVRGTIDRSAAVPVLRVSRFLPASNP
jgi:hypothetical protein